MSSFNFSLLGKSLIIFAFLLFYTCIAEAQQVTMVEAAGRKQIDDDTIVTEAAKDEESNNNHHSSRSKRQAMFTFPMQVQQSRLLGQYQQKQQQQFFPQTPAVKQQQRPMQQQQFRPAQQQMQSQQRQQHQRGPINQQQPRVQQQGSRFPRAHQHPTASPPIHATGSDGTCQNSRGDPGQCVTLAECFPYLTINNQQTIDLLLRVATPCNSDSAPNAIFTQNFGNRQQKPQPQFFQTQTVCCTGKSVQKPVQPVIYPPAPQKPTPPPSYPAVAYPPRTEAPQRKWDKSVLPAYLQHLVPPNVTPVPIQKYPWTVAIMNGERHHCGGSLLSKYTVLTAAHCIYALDSFAVANLRVLLGHHDISSGARAETVTRRVIKTIFHSQFSMRTLHNDIGLLILDQPVPTTTLKVATVKLSTDPVISSGAVTIAGWGQMGWNLPSSPMLMETTIDIWSNRKCAALYGGLAPGGITNDMLCGSAAGKDACRGDSGGPLMMKKAYGYEQVGIVSWGIECGRYPSVHTRISSFLHWIQKNRID